MPTYEIEQYETHVSRFRVEAASPAEAIARIMDGAGELVETSSEYCDIDPDRGMLVEDYPELAAELVELGALSGSSDIIESICSIEEVVHDEDGLSITHPVE